MSNYVQLNLNFCWALNDVINDVVVGIDRADVIGHIPVFKVSSKCFVLGVEMLLGPSPLGKANLRDKSWRVFQKFWPCCVVT